MLIKRALTVVGGKLTLQLVSSLTGLDLNKKICGCYLYVGTEINESKPVELETRCTVILPPIVSVL